MQVHWCPVQHSAAGFAACSVLHGTQRVQLDSSSVIQQRVCSSSPLVMAAMKIVCVCVQEKGMVADMGTVYPVRLPCRSSTTNSSTGSLRLAVAMATGDWNATHVHVVSGMDVATQEACSAHYDGEGALVITMCCLPVAIIIKPCDTCGDSDDDRRRRLGVDAYVGASSSPSPSECALRSAHPKFPACTLRCTIPLYVVECWFS